MCKLRLSIGIGLLLGLVGTAPSAWSQEVHHAPTVEQCRADQRLWMDRLEQTAFNAIANVSYPELTQWRDEMFECQSVDPTSKFLYYNTSGEIKVELVDRLRGFIRRHNLYDQFLAEDAQGKH
jgi:hypothetical protein